jgi:polyphosphate kinase
MSRKHFIPRDISWLSFNARVLQEANDPNVPLQQRIRFLGIFSNNLDEFFRVRVATLRRMIQLGGKKANMHLEEDPQNILDEIQTIVLQQQNEFNRIWEGIAEEMKKESIFLVTEKELNEEQQEFVTRFFDEEVRSNIIPLLIETLPELPYLRDKSIYLGVVMRKEHSAYEQKYALIEVPTGWFSRFIQLPCEPGEHRIILLEDIIRFNLPYIFSYFDYDHFSAHIFKVTKDAELDIDNDVSTTLVQKIEKGLKDRRKGKAVRFVYDKEMDAGLLEYLIRRLNLSRKDNIIPGGRIHNYRHFMDFPNVFPKSSAWRTPFLHPAFQYRSSITDIVVEQDVMLHFPYHSFNPVIDLLREAAMDPDVLSIKITAYRLAPNSKIINALINAVRNGKQVTVMLELRARFDEEANLEWKEKLEEEGVKVLLGVHNMKVHAKVCVIRKKENNKIIQYGFVSTGNLNEKTAKVYADHCLMTANPHMMSDINRIFRYLENPKDAEILKACKSLVLCPIGLRKTLMHYIDREIKNAKAGKKAEIVIKMNSLSDHGLIQKLYEAAENGVKIKCIIRGIFSARPEHKKAKHKIRSISIVDEYLEHARVCIFHNGGKNRILISSADWMVRNLDHRIEVSAFINNKQIAEELKAIINIQLKDNVKARVLDNELSNNYVTSDPEMSVRSQMVIYHYLLEKTASPIEVSSY